MLLSWEEFAEAVAAQGHIAKPLAGRRVLFQPRLELDSIALLMALLLEDCTTVLLPEQDPALCQRLRCQAADAVDLAGHPQPLRTRPDRGFVGWERPPTLKGKVMICSSGSTGEPKSVQVSAHALGLTAAATTSAWPPGSIMALQLPLARVAGLGALLRGWIARTSLLLAKPSALPIWGEVVATHFSVVPSQLLRWWRQEPPASLSRVAMDAREILVGGSAVSHDLLREAQAKGWPLRVTYACTEASGTVAMTPPGDPLAPLEALPHWSWRMEQGCLALRGPSLAEGIVTPSGLQPLADAEGWWATADLIQQEGRGFRWLQRADRIIISGGEKLSPQRLESWLLEQGCTRAWVIGVPHPEWGERPVAFVAGSPYSESALLAHMQELFGKRFAADAILPLPADLAEQDKLPMVRLRQLWTQ